MDLARRDINDHEYGIRLRMPNGSIKYLRTKSYGIRDRDGRLEHIGAIQDVTEHRLSEEALARARSELAHVASVASLATLTASIAHEVNQPLSGIVTNASTCLRMLAMEPPNVDGARETTRLLEAHTTQSNYLSRSVIQIHPLSDWCLFAEECSQSRDHIRRTLPRESFAGRFLSHRRHLGVPCQHPQTGAGR